MRLIDYNFIYVVFANAPASLPGDVANNNVVQFSHQHPPLNDLRDPVTRE